MSWRSGGFTQDSRRGGGGGGGRGSSFGGGRGESRGPPARDPASASSSLQTPEGTGRPRQHGGGGFGGDSRTRTNEGRPPPPPPQQREGGGFRPPASSAASAGGARDAVVVAAVDVPVGREHVYAGRVLEVRERQGLLVEASCGATTRLRGLVERFFFNNKLRRAFQPGDAVEVFCMRGPAPGTGQTAPLVDFCLTAAYVRPLLILDINGVLGVREAYSKGARNRHFVVRESALEFVSFVSQFYEVALWTCSKRETMLNDLRVMYPPGGSDRFCFLWEQDDSTNLWPRASVVDSKKPLFLKELSKVWARYPCFGLHNTVLLDNHVEKFERNPLGTCIAIAEFTAQASEDGALATAGELCLHLRAMAAAGDTHRYVVDRAGTSDLFLERYPAPPPTPPAAIITDGITTSNTATTAAAAGAGAEAAGVSGGVDRCLEFLRLTRHPDEIDHWTQKGELPSTRALNLRKKTLGEVLATRDYLVCEKSDGVRYCLVSTRAGRVYLLDRAMEPVDCAVDASLAAFLSSRAGDTVLDGELVRDMKTGGQTFMVFDAIVVDGARTGLAHSFLRRLGAAEGWLEALLGHPATPPLDIIMKTQVPCGELVSVRSHFSPAAGAEGHGWVFDDGISCHGSDGLIFTPANASYYYCMPLKWKPVELLTVDFSVSFAELSSSRGGGGPYAASVGSGGSSAQVCEVWVDRQQAWVRDLLANYRGQQVVLEAIFSPAEGVWRAIKDRRDKNVPNSTRTAFSTLEAVAENLTLDALVDAFLSTPPPPPLPPRSTVDPADKVSSYTNLSGSALRGRGGGAGRRDDRSYITQQQPPQQHQQQQQVQSQPVGRESAAVGRESAAVGRVASELQSLVVNEAAVRDAKEAHVGGHYDRIQRERWEGGKSSLDENIAVLRKFQNWNKACMIKRLFSSAFDNHARRSLDEMVAELGVAFSVEAVAPLQRLTPRVPAPSGQPQSKRPFRVLDLACGRGGDLNKWTRDCVVSAYVGVDISAEELKEAAERGQELRRQQQQQHRDVDFHFYQSSCDAPGLLGELYEIIAARPRSFLDARAHKARALGGMDVVWCQFALHYFCETEASLAGFLSNVSQALTRGGRFCASFPSPTAVLSHLNRIAHSEADRSGSSVCYISLADPSSRRELDVELGLREFGLAYKFTLGDAVQQCAEFVVPLHALVAMAAGLGLRLVRLQQMHAFMAQCAQDEELVALREVMRLAGPKSSGRPLSADEWDAIGLYCIVVFERV